MAVDDGGGTVAVAVLKLGLVMPDGQQLDPLAAARARPTITCGCDRGHPSALAPARPGPRYTCARRRILYQMADREAYLRELERREGE
jgi:hypothetical protein